MAGYHFQVDYTIEEGFQIWPATTGWLVMATNYWIATNALIKSQFDTPPLMNINTVSLDDLNPMAIRVKMVALTGLTGTAEDALTVIDAFANETALKATLSSFVSDGNPARIFYEDTDMETWDGVLS